MNGTPRIARALLSVYDKTGIEDFARQLHREFGTELISTGGTARALRAAGLPVTLVEDLTGSAEMLDGRVKTLHPRIHAALLADRDNPDHLRQLEAAGIAPIDMVVVNLYPFEETIARPGCDFAEAIEMIDIGGPCMLRAAGKNHRQVLVVESPRWYEATLEWLRGTYGDDLTDWYARGGFGAFITTCRYDAHVSTWLSRHASDDGLPLVEHRHFVNLGSMRYGENPHQNARLLRPADDPGGLNLTGAQIEGDAASVPMSYNNFVDADAALGLCAELHRAFGADRTSSEALWHRRPAGEPAEASRHQPPVGEQPEALWHRRPAGEPAGRQPDRVKGERATRRNLPHLQRSGATYFVTFRTTGAQLSERARDIVLDACRFWDGKRLGLSIATVMPDHVHLIITPFVDDRGAAVPLGELLHSIKSYTAHELVKQCGLSAPVWQDENWDRMLRSRDEFREKWEYVETNAERAGLGEPYRWIARGAFSFEEAGVLQEDHRPEADHRRDACATSGVGADHRRDACATPGEEGDHRRDACATSGEEGDHRRDACATSGEEGDHRRDACATPGEGADHRRDACATPGEGADHGRDACATPGEEGDHRRDACAIPGEEGDHGRDAGATQVKPRRHACVFIKHTNACGVGLDADPAEAYRKAYLGDPNAAMGGILAVDFPVTAGFATKVMETYDRLGRPLREAGAGHAPGGFFVEVWIAPAFDPDAVAVIRGTAKRGPRKDWGKRVRLLAVGPLSAPGSPGLLRPIAGGALLQDADTLGLNETAWTTAAGEVAPDRQDDLRMAWLVCKHTRSNAITICRDGMLLGNGAGQMSRVMSCRIATWLAGENGHEQALAGAVAASDAFFPFADGPQILLDAGITALIQPGGSKRDADTVELCRQRGAALVLTGARHFRH